MQSLNVQRRTDADSSAKLAKLGRIPAVFYGAKEKATSISVALIDFIKTYKKAGETSVVILKDGDHEHEVLIHDMDVHPVTGKPRHADFYVLEKGKKVEVSVPLVFEGISPAVKDLAGILVKVLRELKIEAAPKDLPHEIKVDIAPLVALDSVIHAKDIKLPSGVTLLEGADEVVASISVAKEEVEEVKPIDMTAIEVEKKGKEAKPGAEGEAGAEAAPAADKKAAK